MTIRPIFPLLATLAVGVVACTMQKPAVRTELPADVARAEGLAEDIQADLDTLGWTAARDKLAQLQASSVAAKVTSDEGALDSLAAQIGRRDRLGALQSANRMSRALLVIAAHYNLTVPVEVGLLDVAGRDAIYRAEAGDWLGAAASVAEFRARYAAVQPHVAAKDAALDARFAQRVTALDDAVKAKNAARVRTVATGLLDDMDLVEGTY